MMAVGVAVRWLHLAVSLLLVGTLTASLLAGRSDRATALRWEARLLAWTRRLAILVLLAGLGSLAYQSADAAGRASAALEPAVWLRLLLESHFGTVWLVRHAVLLLLAALVLLREREDSTADWAAFRIEAWLLAAAGAAAAAWAGHAAAVEPSALLAALTDALHLLAVGVWLGALLPLSALLRSASTEGGADARPYAVLAIRRFSPIALAAMSLIITSGLGNAWYEVGSVPALLGTRYGWLLLAKVALLAPVLGLATINRRTLLPALSGDGATVGRPAMARLGHFVAGEATLGLAILAVTSALSLSPPALHESPTWPLSFRLSYADAAAVPGLKARLVIGSQLALIGLLAAVVGLLLRRRRGPVVAAGAAALVAGLWIALPPLAVDAYPTTYQRPTVPYQVDSVAEGAALFRANCARCHGTGGRGDGPESAGLPKQPADLTGTHVFHHTAGDLFWWISHGFARSGMPAFGGTLSEAERWDVINFLRALSDGERARQLGPLVEPNRPWLRAPDFSVVVGPAPARALKDFRGRWMVLLVLFSLPESRSRLSQLAQAYQPIQFSGTEIVAVPMDGDGRILKRLGDKPPILFPVLTDGAEEVVRAYALFSRTADAPPWGRPAPLPRHAELLVDRQGYIRARWIPGQSGRGWDDIKTLLEEVAILDKEAPSAPPAEHVH
ncbi:MAG TPA: CopD family protein [Methylomirabilota bacterium]|nr:CopD family protein [Methylomirabilota bacterium]